MISVVIYALDHTITSMVWAGVGYVAGVMLGRCVREMVRR